MTAPSYTPTIGLEIHAELKTVTKMFCRSKNDPHNALPNTHVCPVCMAHPGTLPVVNKEAVRHVLRVGVALDGSIATYAEFDRKNYFYPDLPKGYQISQYKYPLVSGGSLEEVQLTRIHLEEDTARSQHPSTGSGQAGTESEYSLVDFNRAGVPLMELVTEPVIHDAKSASLFAEELQLVLRTLGVSDANMEKGEMRVEANISVSADEKLGTKVEVKNLNSFRAVERAIEYEIRRQTECLTRGERVVQETRGWSEQKQSTFSQRLKEESQDYRYFPEPDIPKLNLDALGEFTEQALRSSLPELPWEKRERYMRLGVTGDDIEVLVRDRVYATLVEKELEPLHDPDIKRAGLNFLFHDIRGKNPSAAALKNLYGTLSATASMCVAGDISATAAKTILGRILEDGGSPEALASEMGLLQVHDTDSLKALAHDVIEEHASVAKEVKAGKEAALQFLVGQGMKKSKGSAHPKELASLIRKELGIDA